jgi:hypothetical protein
LAVDVARKCGEHIRKAYRDSTGAVQFKGYWLLLLLWIEIISVFVLTNGGLFAICNSACVRCVSSVDLVTETDQNVEKLIFKAISEKYPKHKLIGEEVFRLSFVG